MERFIAPLKKRDSWIQNPFRRTRSGDEYIPVEPVPSAYPDGCRDEQEAAAASQHRLHGTSREWDLSTSKSRRARSSSRKRPLGRMISSKDDGAIPESFPRHHNPSHGVEYIPQEERLPASRDGILGLADPPLQKAEVHISLEDTFTHFCEEELEAGDALWDLVILTGSSSDSDKHELKNGLACTVGQYIEQFWPQSKHDIKDLVDIILSGDDEQKYRYLTRGEYGEVDVCSHATEGGYLEFDFNGASGSIAPLIGALQWLSAVMQVVHESAGPIASNTRLELERGSHTSDGKKLYMAAVDTSEPLKVPEHTSCWTSLFPNTPCALGFPTLRRPIHMEGIEISFDLMCLLSGVEYEVSEQDGLVLYGRHTMLYPVYHYKDCVQWHLEMLGKGGLPQRLKETRETNFRDLEALTDKRHFLGMWDDVKVLLGTKSIGNEELKRLTWSGASEVKKETHRNGWSFGGSVGLPKSFSISATQNFVVAKGRKPQSMANLEANFNRMVRAPVMLYCPSEKRAWLVSYTSVVLHLARVRAALQSETLNYAIPGCEERNDGGMAAFNLVLSCYEQPIKVSTPSNKLSDEAKKYTIGHYIGEVMSAMDTARRESCLASDALTPFRNKLLGFEMADIGHLRPRMKLKQHDLDALASGCWAPLLDEVEYLFFCEGLPDPIVPSTLPDYKGTCGEATWQATPKGFNLLTASLPALIDLGTEYNPTNIDRLTAKYDWDARRVFDSCKRPHDYPCPRLQSIAKRGEGRSPRISINHRKGAVVFKYKQGISKITKELERMGFPTRQSALLEVPRITFKRSPSNTTASSIRIKPGSDSGYETTESVRASGRRGGNGSDRSASSRGRTSGETIDTRGTRTTDVDMSPRPPHRSGSLSPHRRSRRPPHPGIDFLEVPKHKRRRRKEVIKEKRPSTWFRLFDCMHGESDWR